MLIRRKTAAASLRMLSVSNPNPSSHLRMKSASSESLSSSRSPNLPIISNPKMAFSSQRFTISKNLSTTNSVTNSISISNSAQSSFTDEENNIDPESTLVVVSFYKFADFHDHADLRAPLKHLCEQLVNPPLSIYVFNNVMYMLCFILYSVILSYDIFRYYIFHNYFVILLNVLINYNI